jgi:membrane fusion protein (multidrug efflux system)
VVGKDNKALRRKIETSRAYGQSWVVTKGLARGERVILQGLNGLKNGDAIRPVRADAPQKLGAQSGKPAAGKS